MATRGRSKGFEMSEEHRNKIRNSNILRDLIDAGEGRIDMTATRANICLGLLKKVMPDLSQVESNSTVEHRYVARIPDKSASVEQWQQQHEQQPTQH